MAEAEFSDQNRLLRSMEDHKGEDHDLESQDGNGIQPLRNNSGKRGVILDMFHHLNRGGSFSGRRLSYKRHDMDNHAATFSPTSLNIVGRARTASSSSSSSSSDRHNNFNSYPLHAPTGSDTEIDENVDDTAAPEWALLLIACLLGLATGLCVAAFNMGVCFSHLLIFLDVLIDICNNGASFSFHVFIVSVPDFVVTNDLIATFWFN